MKRGEGLESLDFGEKNFQILEFGKGKRGEGLRVAACRNWEELLQHGNGESTTGTLSLNSRIRRIALWLSPVSRFTFPFIFNVFLDSS